MRVTNGRAIVSEQSRSNSCVSLESSFYCDSELNAYGISSSNESSRRLNRRTYMQEYRRKRNIDVIGDENVTELSYRTGRKRKLRTYYFRELYGRV